MPTARPIRQPTRSITPNPLQTNNTISRTLSSKSTLGNSLPLRATHSHASSSPSISIPIRQTPFVTRSTTSALPPRSLTTLSSYSNAYNHAATSNNNRPVSSTSFYQNHSSPAATNAVSYRLQPPEPIRTSTASAKPFEFTREVVIPAKTNSFRTVKYVPSAYNRYRLQ